MALLTAGHVPPEVPQVLINREPLRHMTFDVELLGDCDVIISELCQRLGGTWTSLLDDFESPCVQRGRRSSPEKTNSTLEVESDALGEKETAQVKCANNQKVDNAIRWIYLSLSYGLHKQSLVGGWHLLFFNHLSQF